MAGFLGMFRRSSPSPVSHQEASRESSQETSQESSRGTPDSSPEESRASPEASPAPRQEDRSKPLLAAYGLGGALRLYRDHLEIQHYGFAHMLVEFVSFHTPRLSTRVRLSEITAIEVVRPVVMPDYLVVSYAGAPAPNGGYLHRAFASNALLMSYFENRDFFVIFDRIARADERRDPVDVVV